METAYLKCAVTQNPLGIRESIDFEWEGKSPYVLIDANTLYEIGLKEFKNPLIIGKYKLLLVERQYHMDGCLYVRSDKFGALRVFLHRSTRWLDLAYRRAIITLAVWKLAKYQSNVIPSWRDITIFRRK